MSAHDADDRDTLPLELLVRYADGAVTPAECCRVEAWLAAHPEARADVEAQRRLARLFDEAAPPCPRRSAGPRRWQAWNSASPRRRRRPARRRRAALAVAALAAAAAVLLALALRQPPGGHAGTEKTGQPADEEVWQVVSPDEVEIVSMDDRDRGALVVGEPPVNEPMELLTADEVKVNKLPDVQGRVGRLHVLQGSGAPYIVVSVGQDPDEDP